MTTVTVSPALGELSDEQLAQCWSDGTVDLAELQEECDRRDQAEREAEAARKVRAERQAAARKARQAEWFDAAHAQYLAASDACRGHLLSDLGKSDMGPGQEMQLWRGSDAQAAKYASEDLREWWQANGGRLSWARWQRERAGQARAYRDERDLDRMTAPRTAPGPVTAPRPAPVPVAAPRPAGSIARYIGALGALGRQADRTAARIDALAARLQRGAA